MGSGPLKEKKRMSVNLTCMLHECCFVIPAVLCYTLGADIHAQTEETQETALSLACCGGFQDVAAFLLQAGIIHAHSFPVLTEQFGRPNCLSWKYSLFWVLFPLS